MFNIEDLRSVKILSNLNDAMLDKIKPVTVVKTYTPNSYIFKEGDYAEYLYAVTKGRVALEINIHASRVIRLKDITQGRSFGISSVADTEDRTYIANAKAVEETSVFCWKSSDLEKLFYQDYEMGFLFMRSVGRVLKIRLQVKRAQLSQELSASHM